MAIYLNGNEIDLLGCRFRDGTYSIRLRDARFDSAVLTWLYAGEHELSALMYITWHLREHGCEQISLRMPYIPNARLDRVSSDNEVFTLKYFARVINSLRFDRVWILDPHSRVSCALIDRVSVEYPVELVSATLSDVEERCGAKPLLYYPDEGATKRYSTRITAPYTFGIKKRDWITGVITALEIHGENPSGRNILMVDDICSSGDTMLRSALSLKAAGAANIYFFVTHCENTILDSELLRCDAIKRIYTTNSIYTGSSDKITVYNIADL